MYTMKKIIRLKLPAGRTYEFAKFCVLNEIWTIFSYSTETFLAGTEVNIYVCVDSEAKDELLKGKYGNAIMYTESISAS